jgi:hypothetical protein
MKNTAVAGNRMSASADFRSRARGLVAGELGSLPFCLWLIGWLAALLIHTGSFASIDTLRRYQVTRWFWRGEPEVRPGDFGLLDPNGGLHAWWGFGQSLLMLPGDVVAGAVTALAGLEPPLDVKAEIGIVALLTFPALIGSILVLGYLVLLELGVDPRRAATGVVAWLFGTTCLTYAQVHLENSLEVAALLAVLLGSLRWARSGARLPLGIGVSVGALAILARAPMLVDVCLYIAAAVIIALARRAENPRPWLRQRIKDLALVGVPILVLAVLVDRAYQVGRFGWGSLRTTYIHIWAKQEALWIPGIPAEFPFSGDFASGFLGPLVDQNRSMFLYDPLLIVAPLVFALTALRGKLGRPMSILACAALLDLAWRLLFYAKYVFWNGGSSWSNRYTLTPVQLGLLLVVALFLQLASTSRAARMAFWGAFTASAALQFASVLFSVNLEIIQGECRGGTYFALRDRIVNVWRLASGTLGDDGCRRLSENEVLRVQFFPWSNASELPESLQVAIKLGWFALLIALGSTIYWTLRLARRRV